jgi:hypothetical protein
MVKDPGGDWRRRDGDFVGSAAAAAGAWTTTVFRFGMTPPEVNFRRVYR